MGEQLSYEGLHRPLEERWVKRLEGFYTTCLLEKGLGKILKKVGEECTEVITAAKDRDHKETVYELADLAYHVLVPMVGAGIPLDGMRAELAGRHVIGHKVKQEEMASDQAERGELAHRAKEPLESQSGSGGFRLICTGPVARRPQR